VATQLTATSQSTSGVMAQVSGARTRASVAIAAAVSAGTAPGPGGEAGR
jgi:hypothetical protein